MYREQTMSNTIDPINYKEYPECMFAIISAYLPRRHANELRGVTGEVIFKHTDQKGNTYKNGLLHSFNDQPAVNFNNQKIWYRDGKVHRDGDLPARIVQSYIKKLYKNGDPPKLILQDYSKEWYKNGKLHREGDLPAWIQGVRQGWYKNGKRHRDGDKPAFIGYRNSEFWVNGKKYISLASPQRDTDTDSDSD